LLKKNGIHGKFEENLGKIGILGKILANNLEYLGKIWMDYLLNEKWNT
jgi:hypothetical protein